jgi:hypothetical protein
MSNAKATQIVGDKMEYRRIDPKRRLVELEQWNKPIFWPLWLMGALLMLSIVPAWRGFRARERASALPPPGRARGAAGELALGIASPSGSTPRA